jgi:hypothetical protein
MKRDEAQGWLADVLMDKVRGDRFPSPVQLEMIEEVIPREKLPEYIELLIEKAEQDNYPSLPMLRRIHRVAAALPKEDARDLMAALPAGDEEDEPEYDEEE